MATRDDDHTDYKRIEKAVFDEFWPNQPYREWTVRRLTKEVEILLPSLANGQRKSAAKALFEANKLRTSWSKQFGPSKRFAAHEYFRENNLKLALLLQREEKQTDIHHTFSDFSLQDLDFESFMEEIGGILDKALQAWILVAENKMKSSVAAIVTATHLSHLMPLIQAESAFIHPEWFDGHGRLKPSMTARTELWMELSECSRQVPAILHSTTSIPERHNMPLAHWPVWLTMVRMAEPDVKSSELHSAKQGTLNLQGKGNLEGNVSAFPLVAIVGAAFLARVERQAIDRDTVLSMIRTRMEELETITRRLHAVSFGTYSFVLQNVKSSLPSVLDIPTRGFVLALLEILTIQAIRILAFNDSCLQLLAHACESSRIKGEELPEILDKVLDSPEMSPFLWQSQRRPKSVKACKDGMSTWCLTMRPGEQRDKFFNARNSTILSQLILDQGGCVPRDMSKLLRGLTLEERIRSELELPDLPDLPTLLSLIETTAGDSSGKVDWHDPVKFRKWVKKQFSEEGKSFLDRLQRNYEAIQGEKRDVSQ